MSKISESKFQKEVIKYLTDNNCYIIKYWGGGNFTKKGVPDLLICYNGYFFGFELKKDKKAHREILQYYNIEQIRKAGGFACFLYPKIWERVKKYLENGEYYNINKMQEINLKILNYEKR